MSRSEGRDATAKSVRTSVTISADDHEELERIAEHKKVSLAWVIRDAVERYLANESPLFRRHRGNGQ